MEELHLAKKDFKVDWYSGSGAGGQHRNKHPNCCRITHIETGVSAIGTESKSRETNKKNAFERLTKKIVPILMNDVSEGEISDAIIRNYNRHRDEVHDKESGLKQSYKEVVDKNNISDMIQSRNQSMKVEEFNNK